MSIYRIIICLPVKLGTFYKLVRVRVTCIGRIFADEVILSSATVQPGSQPSARRGGGKLAQPVVFRGVGGYPNYNLPLSAGRALRQQTQQPSRDATLRHTASLKDSNFYRTAPSHRLDQEALDETEAPGPSQQWSRCLYLTARLMTRTQRVLVWQQQPSRFTLLVWLSPAPRHAHAPGALLVNQHPAPGRNQRCRIGVSLWPTLTKGQWLQPNFLARISSSLRKVCHS